MRYFIRIRFISIQGFLVTLFLITNSGATPLSYADDLKPISLQEAIDYAIAHHPQLKIAQIDVGIRKAGITESRSGLFPEISVNALETTGFPSSTGGLEVRGLANSPYKRGWGVDVEVEQILFDFGRTAAIIRSAKSKKDAAEASGTLVQMEVVLEIHRAYALCQMYQDRMSLYQSIFDDTKLMLDEIRKFVKTGQRSPIESALMGTRLDELKQSQILTERLMEENIAQLNFSMGVSGANQFTIKQGGLHVLSDEALGLQPFAQLLSTALRDHPKVKMLEAEERQAEANVDKAQSEYLPKIVGVVNAGTFYDTRFVKRDDYAAGVALKIPLFDGLKTPSHHEQATLKEDRSRQEKQQFENAIQLQIRKLVLDFQQFVKLRPIVEDQLSQSKGALQLAKERYLSKSGLLAEMDQAQKAYINARENDLQMRFKLLLSDVLLKQALGGEK